MDFSGFKLKKRPITSSKKLLADEVWRYFGRELVFGRIMLFINKLGEKAVREIFSEIRQSPSSYNKIAGFIFRCNDNLKKIEWE